VFQIFPLLALSLVAYLVPTLLERGALGSADWIGRSVASLSLTSGDVWKLTFGDLFIVFSLVLLFLELLRATQTDRAALLNHIFSVVVFVAALLLFVLAPGFGNSTFFIFTTMTLIDFLAGFVVTTVSARRDLAVSDSFQ